MRDRLKSLALSALGAAAMYYLDPERGRRRRALMRDRLDLVSQEASDFMQDQGRWAAAQVKGLAASARQPFSRASASLGNDGLAERIDAEREPSMSRPGSWDWPEASRAGMSQGGLMVSLFKVAAFCAASAAAMYYLDPEMGRRRRAGVRDKFGSMSHEARDYARTRSRMAADRAKGLLASARAPLEARLQSRSDRQLCERIRSELGRLVSHPKAIEVEVNHGNVSLRGQVLASEVDRLLGTVQGMTGVEHVDNQLQAHEEPGRISSLQSGEHRAPGDRTASRPAGGASSWH